MITVRRAYCLLHGYVLRFDLGFNQLEKSKESRFWLMASEHSTTCLVDRDALTP